MNQRPTTSDSTTSSPFFITEKPFNSPSTRKSSTSSLISPISTNSLNRKSLKISTIPLSSTHKPNLIRPPSTDRSTKHSSTTRTHRTLRPPSLQPQDEFHNLPLETFHTSRPTSPPKSIVSMMNIFDKSFSPKLSPNSGYNNPKSTWRPESKSLLRVSSLSRTFTRTSSSSGFRYNRTRGSLGRLSPESKVKETIVDKAKVKIKNIMEGCDKLQEEYVRLEKSLQYAEIRSREKSPREVKGNEGKQMLKFDFWKYDEGFNEARAKMRNEVEKIREEEKNKQKLRETVEAKGGIENMNKKMKKKGDVPIKAEDLLEPSEMIKFILQKPRSFSIKRTPSSTRKAERLFMATPLPEKQREKIASSPIDLSIEKSPVRIKKNASTLLLNDGGKVFNFNIKLQEINQPSIFRDNYNISRNSGRESILKHEESERGLSPVPYKSVASINESPRKETKEIRGGFSDLFTRDKSKMNEQPVVIMRTPSVILNETVVKVQKILETPKITNDELFMAHKKGFLRKSDSVQKMYRSASMRDL